MPGCLCLDVMLLSGRLLNQVLVYSCRDHLPQGWASLQGARQTCGEIWTCEGLELCSRCRFVPGAAPDSFAACLQRPFTMLMTASLSLNLQCGSSSAVMVSVRRPFSIALPAGRPFTLNNRSLGM